MKSWDEYDKRLEEDAILGGSAVAECSDMHAYEVEIATRHGHSWYRSKSKRGGEVGHHENTDKFSRNSYGIIHNLVSFSFLLVEQKMDPGGGVQQSHVEIPAGHIELLLLQ